MFRQLLQGLSDEELDQIDEILTEEVARRSADAVKATE